MSTIPSIGEVIRQWRKFHKLNVTEFAKRAGFSKGYISELENNKIDNPSPPNMEKLAAAVGISVLDLHARRMPNDTTSKQTRATVQQPPIDDDDFIFASPVEMPRRGGVQKEQLRQVLAQVDTLRATLEALIDEAE